MNLGARTFLGAVAGALIVLLIHPRSRPFLLSKTLWPSSAQAIKRSPKLPENAADLPSPVSLDEASLWLQTGAEQELNGSKLSESDSLTLSEIAWHGEKAEPDNAFWAEMKSVFVGKALTRIGEGQSSTVEDWIRASHLTTWNDHQTDRLTSLTKDLELATGAPFAWQQAVAYSRRSFVVPQLLLRHSRQLAREYPNDNRIRVANIFNGCLIRNGAKSIPGCSSGASMVDMAAYQIKEPPQNSNSGVSGSDRVGSIFHDLSNVGHEQLRQIDNAVSYNEAWYALIPLRDYSQRSIDLIRGSILVAVLPSALFVSGLIGIVLYLLGAYVAVLKPVRRVLSSPWAMALGLAAGGAVYFAGRFVFAAIWAFLVLAAFGLVSERSKSAVPTGLGVVYKGTLALLAVVVMIALSVHFLEASASEQLLANAAALPAPDGSTNVVPIQLCFLGLSMVVATAPTWGFLYRYEPSVVLPTSLKSFGQYLSVLGLSLAVIATPICLLSDQKLAKDLSELVHNEPNHYLARSSGP